MNVAHMDGLRILEIEKKNCERNEFKFTKSILKSLPHHALESDLKFDRTKIEVLMFFSLSQNKRSLSENRRKRNTKIIAKMSKSDLLTIQISNLKSSVFTNKTSKKCEITEDVPKLTTQKKPFYLKF